MARVRKRTRGLRITRVETATGKAGKGRTTGATRAKEKSGKKPSTSKPSATNSAIGTVVEHLNLPILPWSVSLLRREDCVALKLTFVNLKKSTAGTTLLPGNARKPSFIIVEHGPQHLIEEAMTESNTPETDPLVPPPIRALLSGPSRIVFRVPASYTPIPFTTVGLLEACRDCEMVVGPNAAAPPMIKQPLKPGNKLLRRPGQLVKVAGKQRARRKQAAPTTASLGQAVRMARATEKLARSSGVDLFEDLAGQLPPLSPKPHKPRPPKSDETALELPFRLILSPNPYAAWAHSSTAQLSPTSQRTELWHTRLRDREEKDGTEAPHWRRQVRAVWTRDLNPENQVNGGLPPSVFPDGEASLEPGDRADLVDLTANFDLPGYKPKAVKVNRLMLTALGGWLDLHGEFGEDAPRTVSLWEHRAAQGRDHYVKVVKEGYLYPFGHRAALLKITERKLPAEHAHTAYLRKRYFVIIRQPVVQYQAGYQIKDVGALPQALRQSPFAMIHIKTRKTPNLDVEGEIGPNTDLPLTVDGKLFLLDCEATDREGNLVRFGAPAAFVEGNKTAHVTNAAMHAASEWLVGSATKCYFHGQRVAFAEARDADDTTYEVDYLIWGGTDQALAGTLRDAGYEAGFLPLMAKANLVVEAVRQLAGATGASEYSYASEYLVNGFGGEGEANAGELLLVTDSAVSASFTSQSDRSGGFVTPNLKVTGLSRKVGPVCGSSDSLSTNVAAGSFDPGSFFEGCGAKLFGVFDLMDILNVSDLLGAPRFITQALDEGEAFLQDLKAMQAQLQGLDGTVNQVIKDWRDAVTGILDTLGEALSTGELGSLPDYIDKLHTACNGIVGNAETVLGELDKGVRELVVRRLNDVMSVIVNSDVEAALEAFANAMDMVKNQCVKLEWRPALQNVPSDAPIFFLPGDDDGRHLLLSVEARAKPQKGKPAGVDVLASLERFDINLIAPATCMTLHFDKVQFRMLAGKKPDVDVQFAGIEFKGPLAFVEVLRQVIPLDGFSDPPNLAVTAEGIEASFQLPLPSLAVGVFSLENLSLGAGFRVPFIGDPLTISFNFCTRENPFVLTVCMLGGGGFFGITLSPEGVQLLEASFEARAALSVDFGVASGSISIAVGVYFRMESDTAQLTGYLRMRGEVDVLGLISASIELYMELTYEFSSGKLVGRASLEIEVEIVCVSFTVTLECERKFAGSNGDPTFAQVMGPGPDYPERYPWLEYVEAFAA